MDMEEDHGGVDSVTSRQFSIFFFAAYLISMDLWLPGVSKECLDILTGAELLNLFRQGQSD
jgi:hypothetical protein